MCFLGKALPSTLKLKPLKSNFIWKFLDPSPPRQRLLVHAQHKVPNTAFHPTIHRTNVHGQHRYLCIFLYMYVVYVCSYNKIHSPQLHSQPPPLCMLCCARSFISVPSLLFHNNVICIFAAPSHRALFQNLNGIPFAPNACTQTTHQPSNHSYEQATHLATYLPTRVHLYKVLKLKQHIPNL